MGGFDPAPSTRRQRPRRRDPPLGDAALPAARAAAMDAYLRVVFSGDTKAGGSLRTNTRPKSEHDFTLRVNVQSYRRRTEDGAGVRSMTYLQVNAHSYGQRVEHGGGDSTSVECLFSTTLPQGEAPASCRVHLCATSAHADARGVRRQGAAGCGEAAQAQPGGSARHMSLATSQETHSTQ